MDSGDPFCVDPASFTLQMEFLASTGVVESLDRGLDRLDSAGDRKPQIAITFDDGTEDFIVHVLPHLARLRIPAVLYVSPERIGSPGFLGWNEVGEAARAGVAVGSHGLDHRSLGRLGPREAVRQVVESKQRLEDRLGLPVRSLAYPFGTLTDFNDAVKREIEKAGYRAACTSLNGVNRRETDRYELRRTKIEQGDGPLFPGILDGHLDGWFFVDRYLWFLQNRYD